MHVRFFSRALDIAYAPSRYWAGLSRDSWIYQRNPALLTPNLQRTGEVAWCSFVGEADKSSLDISDGLVISHHSRGNLRNLCSPCNPSHNPDSLCNRPPTMRRCRI